MGLSQSATGVGIFEMVRLRPRDNFIGFQALGSTLKLYDVGLHKWWWIYIFNRALVVSDVDPLFADPSPSPLTFFASYASMWDWGQGEVGYLFALAGNAAQVDHVAPAPAPGHLFAGFQGVVTGRGIYSAWDGAQTVYGYVDNGAFIPDALVLPT